MNGKRPGRRPGHPNTRGAILAAARDTFAANGFAHTTIRAVAAETDVDPALVHHYFGTKRDLFVAAIELTIDLGGIVESILAGPRDALGRRIAHTVLAVWDSPRSAAMLAALRSALSDPVMARMIREFVFSEVIGRVLTAIGCPPAERALRGSLLASQILGVITGRHLLGLEPLASVRADDLIGPLGATLQHYLTGPVT